MACTECENNENFDCNCNTENCNCAVKLSTVCSIYEGVKLTILDTYEGQDLESILKKAEELFADIYDTLQSQLYKNIGTGAKVFKRVNGLTQAEFRTILSSDSIDILEDLEHIGIFINETWLENFILSVDAETTTNITALVTGKRIANYTNEDGISQGIDETVTTFVKNTDGTFTYTNELGSTTTLNIEDLQTLTTITNTIQGKRIATYTNEVGTTVDIRETITSVVLTGNSGFTFTNENGASISYRPQDATTSVKGLSEAATQAETNTGTDTSRYVTPATLSGRTATQSRSGVTRFASQAEANALSFLGIAIAPGTIPRATTTQQGITRFATRAEMDAGTATNLIVSPSLVKQTINPDGGSPTGGAGIFLAKGKILLGDVAGQNVGQSIPTTGDFTSCTVTAKNDADMLITVTMQNVGTTDYQPNVSLQSRSTNYDDDNDVIFIVRNPGLTSFQIGFRELSNNRQNIHLLVSLLKL